MEQKRREAKKRVSEGGEKRRRGEGGEEKEERRRRRGEGGERRRRLPIGGELWWVVVEAIKRLHEQILGGDRDLRRRLTNVRESEREADGMRCGSDAASAKGQRRRQE